MLLHPKGQVARGPEAPEQGPAGPRGTGIFRRLPHDSALATVLCGIALAVLFVLLLRWHLAG
jgi:hypothetical protein